jgi:hypoxanthine phosphoribosyltransferase
MLQGSKTWIIQPLIDGSTLDCGLKLLADSIKEKLTEKNIFLPILKGGAFVAHELFHRFPLKESDKIGYIGVRSYLEGEISSGADIFVYNELFLKEEDFEDATVFVIDDVCETGRTLLTIRRMLLEKFKCKNIITIALVNKNDTIRKVEVGEGPDMFGFGYNGGRFLVGCGMDFKEMYRGLPFIGHLVLGE